MSGLVIILFQGAASSKHLWNNSGHLKNATCCPSQAESDVMTWHDGAKRAGHMFGIESHQVESSLDQMLSSVVGSWLLLLRKKGYGLYNSNARYPLPMKPSQLNQLCKKYNRDGQLCGKCQKGFAPPVYSYSVSCVNCAEYTKNWVKYVAISFLPLTGFFILIVTFRISATSGTMNTFILISQTMTMPLIMRVLTLKSVKSPSSGHVLMSLYSIGNLDFFRLQYSPFCLHPKMTTTCPSTST